jgi:SAM-dependent methyltransferase
MFCRFVRGAARTFIHRNRSLSRVQARAAARWAGRTSGSRAWHAQILPGLLRPSLHVLDVGGGKQPQIDRCTKQRLGLHVTGLDVSREELSLAPPGAYDEIIVGDVSRVHLSGPFDLILSCTVLEHVADNSSAMAALAAALAPGGTMAHYIPCRNAPFARLNLVLGKQWSRRILFAVYPEKADHGGYPAFYDHCTPLEMRRLIEGGGLVVSDCQCYFASEYMSFFTPLYSLELLRQLTAQALGADQWCETFAIVASKPAAADACVRRAS